MNLIDQWLEVVKRAGFMSGKQYQEWQFIVGTGGSLKQRIELGKKAIDELTTLSRAIGTTFTFNASSSPGITTGRRKEETPIPTITNAVSPLSGDFSTQRGIKRI